MHEPKSWKINDDDDDNNETDIFSKERLNSRMHKRDKNITKKKE